MSYKVSYGKPMAVEIAKRKKFLLLPALVAVIFLGVFGYYFYNEEFTALSRALIPWIRPDVRNAIAEMTENIGQGVPVGEAITVFCKEILHGATVLE